MRVLCPRGPRPITAFLWPSLLLLTALIPGCGGGSLAVDLGTIAAISAPGNTLRVNQTMQLYSHTWPPDSPSIFGQRNPRRQFDGRHHHQHRTLHRARRRSHSLYRPDHQLHRPISQCHARFGFRPGLESHSGARQRSIPADSPRATPPSLSTARSLFTARRSVGTAPSFPRLMFRHRTRRADRRAQSRHFSAHRHQSQSRLGNRASRFR